MIGANRINKNIRDNIDSRVHPVLKTKAIALEQYAAKMGIVFGYPDYSGFRSMADTTKLIRWRDEAVAKQEALKSGTGFKAYYPVAPYGVGFHPHGAAFDIDVVSWPKDKTEAWAYATLGAYAPRIGLTWGGTFSGKQKDIFHFQLAISLDAAKKQFAQYQASLTSQPSIPIGTAPPKLGSAPLTAAVNAIRTTQGAAALVAVALLAVVASGFFLLPVLGEGIRHIAR